MPAGVLMQPQGIFIMNLFTVNFSAIPLAKPLSYSLRNEEGLLLARKGHMFFHRAALLKLAGHGTLCVDMHEINAYRESMAQHKAKKVEPSGVNNGHGSTSNDRRGRHSNHSSVKDQEPVDWFGLQSRTNAVLRQPLRETFPERLGAVQGELLDAIGRSPDSTLLALMHMAAEENNLYSATHAMLVGTVCALAAQDVLDWPEDLKRALISAALTMNISMTELQDQLIIQTTPLSPDQQKLIDSHAQRSVAMLQELGITDDVWLGAISQHHSAQAGTFRTKSPAEQIARLIHRADVFVARLSPRASRPSMDSPAAMKSAYFDETNQVDEAGTSIIKALGIYHPGALVILASGEIGIVVRRRGSDMLHPTVAALLSRQGMPMAEPVLRDTSLPANGIVANVSRSAVKVRTDLLRLLAVA